ncbi:MAG TPA: hypothetical protein VK335_12240 [Bryobacteraceae bacterium]|nr:hypothetical protein [Bryobacteraceae bacterium]
MAKLWFCGVLITAPLVLWADHGELNRLIAESTRLRELTPNANPYEDHFGRLTRPDWTELENRLRDWIESRLPANISTLGAALPTMEAQLTSELRRAAVFQPENPDAVVGHVSMLKVSRPVEYPNVVAVQSGISVPCGSDVTFHLYRFTSTGRERVLDANGSSNWGNDGLDTRFSAPDPAGNRVLYLSWYGVQCASVWDGLEYRVIRLSPEADHAVTVLSDIHTFVIDEDVHVKITPDELLLELTAEAMEGGFRRTYVMHYRISAGTERIDPVALQPQDFVHEWLTRSWSEMQSRSSASVAKWHKFLHADYVGGEYAFVQPCKERPGITQVGVGMRSVGDLEFPEPLGVCFLVEDMGDYRFKMSEVSFDRQPGCPGESYASYDNPPSLFKKQ